MISFEGMPCTAAFGFFSMTGGGGVLGFSTGADTPGAGGAGGGGGGAGGAGGALGGSGSEDLFTVEYKGSSDFTDEVSKLFMLESTSNFLSDKELYLTSTSCFTGFGRGEGGL